MGKFTLFGLLLCIPVLVILVINLNQHRLDRKYPKHPKRKKWQTPYIFHLVCSVISLFWLISILIPTIGKPYGIQMFVCDILFHLGVGMTISSAFFFTFKLIVTASRANSIKIEEQPLAKKCIASSGFLWTVNFVSDGIQHMDTRYRAMNSFSSGVGCVILVYLTYKYSKEILKELVKASKGVKSSDSAHIVRFKKTTKKLLITGTIACVTFFCFVFLQTTSKHEIWYGKENYSGGALVFQYITATIVLGAITNIFYYPENDGKISPMGRAQQYEAGAKPATKRSRTGGTSRGFSSAKGNKARHGGLKSYNSSMSQVSEVKTQDRQSQGSALSRMDSTAGVSQVSIVGMETVMEEEGQSRLSRYNPSVVSRYDAEQLDVLDTLDDERVEQIDGLEDEEAFKVLEAVQEAQTVM